MDAERLRAHDLHTSTRLTMHPVTLRFSDETQEIVFRKLQFQGSYLAYQACLFLFACIHLFMTWISAKYHVITAIYFPIIAVAAVLRMYLSRMKDQARAHQLTSRAFCIFLTIGPGAQRLAIAHRLHPRIELVEATLYMTSYVGTFLLLHLMYVDFSHRAYSWVMVFLSLSTAGWNWCGHGGSDAWTTLGQPYDSLVILAALVVGEVLGYSIERMLRGSYLQRRVSSSTVSGQGDFELDIATHSFETLGLIGRGGSSDVFLVRREGTSSRLFAMKRVTKSRLPPSALERLKEETRILQTVSHPFVIRLHYSFESASCLYFAMTYASGGDLTRWAEEDIDSKASCTLTCEVLVALEYLHGMGIIYRDLKPENTLIGSDGHIILADFGVSKRMHATMLPPLTEPDSPLRKSRFSTHTQVGTLEYMSPELFDGSSYSYEVDFWALAVMLHELLTGYSIGNRKEPKVLADMLEPVVADMISAMLQPDRPRRLGYTQDGAQDGAKAIKAHAYFNGVDWDEVLSKRVLAPFAMRPPTSLAPSATGGGETGTGDEQGTCHSRPAAGRSVASATMT